MKRKQVDLAGAERIYAVSDAPLFLLRKLQADAAAREISSSLSVDEILDELKTSLQTKPRTLREAVEPYVLLVALQKKRNIDALKTAATLNAPYHDWFTYLSDVLLQTFTSTATMSLAVRGQSLVVPGQMVASPPANTSTAQTRTRILKLES